VTAKESGNTIKNLQKIVGKESVLTSKEDILSFSYDASPLERHSPDAIVLPVSVEQVQNLVKLARQDGLKLIPRGSGTGLSGGSVASTGGIVVSFTRMNRILEIDNINLTATVEPGVITAHMATAVEKQGLYFPPY